ncbi:AI-2E family transporter [Capsulimonas corticalis]|uniref:AI-2E family transporter n=1 Tax=Capsulimonas corticalis TaxID=2219043 RepID=A0A402D6Z8_9BACT|nr:AI-2E family transporter [Capsulimonas corticalis]BDI29358.1 AI-2E family transporter [Capsulimonas corticalis]
MIDTPKRKYDSLAEEWFAQVWKFVWRIALIVFTGYVIWRIRTILTDVLVAAIFAFALIGPVDWLCRYRIRGLSGRAQRLLVTLVVFVVLGIIVVKCLALMIVPFQSQVHELGQNLPHYKTHLLSMVSSAKNWFSHLPPDVQAFLQRQGATGEGISPGSWVRGMMESTFAGLAKIVDIILIPVLAFYFVLDGHSLRNEFLALVPPRRRREALRLLRASSTIMRTFVIAQFWLCVIAGVVVYIGLNIAGMNYSLILGLLAGVTRAIPIIGPIIAGIPIVLLAAIQSPMLAVKILIFFSVMHLVESKLIMPKFIGHKIHLHAALVIIVLLIGGEFFGLIGMFMAAPIAAFGRVLLLQYVIRPRRIARAVKSAAANTSPPPSPLIIKSQ